VKETVMRQSKAVIAVVAVLMAAMSVSVFARGHSGGGRGGHGGHAFSGARGPGSAGHVAPQRHFRGGARIGVFIGAPLYAPFFYPAPGFYYSPPPPAYIEQAPTQNYWYFCPESNAYYPYVQECPGGWQPVLPQPSG
jgi:hypothetical protein